MNNRLYCTFTTLNNYEEVANTIQTSYVILFDKLFVLESLDGEKIMLTYNVDMGNSSNDFLVDNTILVHRKKQTNTLYTINALNELIKSLNNGFLDKSYAVNWNDYRNCILLIHSNHKHTCDTIKMQYTYQRQVVPLIDWHPVLELNNWYHPKILNFDWHQETTNPNQTRVAFV